MPESSRRTENLITFLRIFGGACGLTIIALGLYGLIVVDSDIKDGVNDVYRIIFGILIVIAEFRWTRLLVWFSFLVHFIGLGGWYIFVGLLALGDEVYEYVITAILCSVGLIYCG